MNFNQFRKKINSAKEQFALSGVFVQLAIVILVGFIIVVVSGLIMGSVKSTYLIFIDPPALFTMEGNNFYLFFSFVLMLFGLVVGGFIISVLSSWLENTFRDIRSGHLEYIGSGHTVIVNYNKNIYIILQELDLLYENQLLNHDVVILIGDNENIQTLQFEIKKINFSNINIYVRHGDVLSWKRYLDISILSINSIIVLNDERIKDPFARDNQNLRILNLLFSQDTFKSYLAKKRQIYAPIKSVVEFTQTNHFEKIVAHITDSLFIAIAPKDVLSSILNLSMIDIYFFNAWSQLLSFAGHEFYFIEAQKYHLVGCSYRDLLLRHKKGLLVGISRTVDGEFKLLFNKHDETISQTDWLIVIANGKNNIFFEEKPLSYEENHLIEQPKEILKKQSVIIGEKREIRDNDLLDNDSIEKFNPTDEELFADDYFEKIIYADKRPDNIIINLDDETMYRIALSLKVFYPQEDLKPFVFLVDDALIAEQLIQSGFNNTILSNLLFSKYIAQVSNQMSLHNVFRLLFEKNGPKLNFIEASRFSDGLLDDLDNLKAQLVYNGMVYLGCVNKDKEIEFEATDISGAIKIIVLSNGDA